MKKQLFLAAYLLSALTATAQLVNDPVIMTVAGTAVPRSEFEYSYNKNNTDGVIDKKNVEEYVDLFVNYKLKVQAALDARIDTTQAFLTEFAQYRDQQIVPTFVTDDDMLEEAHKVYDQTVESIGPDGLVSAVCLKTQVLLDVVACWDGSAKTRPLRSLRTLPLLYSQVR